MSFYRLDKPVITRSPHLWGSLPEVQDPNRPNLRPLMGERVLVVGGQGTTVPGSLDDLRAANARGERIPIGNRALAFRLNNEQMAEEGLRLYAERADAAFDHVNIGYEHPGLIDRTLPNIRQLHGGDNYAAGNGMPLAATGIVAPYPRNPNRMGVEETQDVFAARYLHSQLSRLDERLRSKDITPQRYNQLTQQMLGVTGRLESQAKLLYDAPKRTIDNITKALNILSSKGVADQINIIAPGGFNLPSGFVPYTRADFIRPGAGPLQPKQAGGKLSAKEAYDAQVRADRIREIRERQGR